MADQLATDIIAKIKAHAEPGGEEITTNTELTSLGIHSLELTEIIFDLEEAVRHRDRDEHGRCLEQSEECRRHGRGCSRADREKSLTGCGKRVVITGIGGLCGLGTDAPAIWNEMRAGRSAIGPIDNPLLHDLKVKIGCEIKALPEHGIDRKQIGVDGPLQPAGGDCRARGDAALPD